MLETSDKCTHGRHADECDEYAALCDYYNSPSTSCSYSNGRIRRLCRCDDSDCAAAACPNGGACTDGDGSWHCDCVSGITGNQCDQCLGICPGTWHLGDIGDSCSDVCSGAGRACADGDWGVHDEAGFRSALTAAGADPGSLCSGGFSGCDGRCDGMPPLICVAGGMPCGPSSCYYTLWNSSCSASPSLQERHLCRCQ